MGIKDKLFKWFKSNENNGKEMNLGFVLDGEPKTIEDLRKVFKAFNLESKFKLLKPLVRSKIGIELIPSYDTKFGIGQSKIGGKPDLINLEKWPTTNSAKHLSFIAQLNCAELIKFDKDRMIPSEGLISFFYCADQKAWGFDPKDNDKFQVVYTESINNLKRIDFPKDLKEHSIFQPNELKFEQSLSVPGWEQGGIDRIISVEEMDNYFEVSSGVQNQIFGYANCVQGSMELECQLVTNGLFCGDQTGYTDPRRKELESGKDDWILLFQIDSEEDKAGMMWGDLGKLFFWIKKQDLKDKNFNKSWFTLQSH